MTTAKQESHLKNLWQKHQDLEDLVQESYANYASDQEVSDLKKQRLAAKQDYLAYADSLDGAGLPDDY